MVAFDRLPPDLRGWLSTAALPWSPRSALRAWQVALRRTRGDQSAALDRLSRTELRQLRKDAPRVWPCRHPVCDDTVISKKA
jgi:hypothetical protein